MERSDRNTLGEFSMATETKTIKVAPDSELGLLLAEVGGGPVILDKDGERYVLAREDAQDIWAAYDPEAVQQALHQSAGALAGIDRKSLLEDIHAARKQDSRARPGR